MSLLLVLLLMQMTKCFCKKNNCVVVLYCSIIVTVTDAGAKETLKGCASSNSMIGVDMSCCNCRDSWSLTLVAPTSIAAIDEAVTTLKTTGTGTGLR